MPIKFLVAGDLHYRSSNPFFRKDNYLEAITHKLYEVAELAEKYEVKAVILPGDLFDSASVSLSTIAGLALVLSSFPCPILTVPGNHDEFGHSLNSIPRTPYGLLEKLRYIKNLHEKFEFFASESVDIIVTGRGFDAEMDQDLSQYSVPANLCVNGNGRELAPFYIHVAHGNLLDEPPVGPQRLYTLVAHLENIPEESQPHILVCGHVHFGLPLQKIGRTLVVNPGALARTKAHLRELDRQIKVALLTINDINDYHSEFIPLTTALPGDKVLSREHIEAKIESSKKLDEFFALLASESEEKFLEVREIIENIVARENIPLRVKREALERLARAQERKAKTQVEVASGTP